MTKEKIIQEMGNLAIPSNTAISEYKKQLPAMLIFIKERFVALPDMNAIIGNNTLELLEENHQNHSNFIISLWKNYTTRAFFDTLKWVLNVYTSRGFNIRYWKYMTSYYKEAMIKHLSKDTCKELIPYYDFINQYMPIIYTIKGG